MKLKTWVTAVILLLVSAASGCSSKPANNTPKANANGSAARDYSTVDKECRACASAIDKQELAMDAFLRAWKTDTSNARKAMAAKSESLRTNTKALRDNLPNLSGADLATQAKMLREEATKMVKDYENIKRRLSVTLPGEGGTAEDERFRELITDLGSATEDLKLTMYRLADAIETLP